MEDIKEIRRKLWDSLEMDWIRQNLILLAALYGLVTLIFFLTGLGNRDITSEAVIISVKLLAFIPFLAFFLWRAAQIFRRPERYIFCKAVLSNPKGGSLRDTIKFTVVLEDEEGGKFVADTHSIFQTHKGMLGFAIEDYVNRTVTIAYNEETDMVVVIG